MKIHWDISLKTPTSKRIIRLYYQLPKLNQPMKTLEKIEKEALPNLKFSKSEVIQDPEQRKLRAADLYRAQTLGNLLHTKVNITFETEDHQFYIVNTTVWAVGNDFVSLKSGIFLPIQCIHEIN